jgi:hypothetical protein
MHLRLRFAAAGAGPARAGCDSAATVRIGARGLDAVSLAAAERRRLHRVGNLADHVLRHAHEALTRAPSRRRPDRGKRPAGLRVRLP